MRRKLQQKIWLTTILFLAFALNVSGQSDVYMTYKMYLDEMFQYQPSYTLSLNSTEVKVNTDEPYQTGVYNNVCPNGGLNKAFDTYEWLTQRFVSHSKQGFVSFHTEIMCDDIEPRVYNFKYKFFLRFVLYKPSLSGLPSNMIYETKGTDSDLVLEKNGLGFSGKAFITFEFLPNFDNLTGPSIINIGSTASVNVVNARAGTYYMEAIVKTGDTYSIQKISDNFTTTGGNLTLQSFPIDKSLLRDYATLHIIVNRLGNKLDIVYNYSRTVIQGSDLKISVEGVSSPNGRVYPPTMKACLVPAFDELEKLYDATAGNQWTNKSNWFTNPDLSTWFGVTLTADGCDVATINLVSNNLVGSLPNLALPKLNSLILNSNTLSGSLPDFSGTGLGLLRLSYNQFSGSVPNFTLPSLTSIDLGYNQLSGNFPSLNLPNLTLLSVYHNNISGSIPSDLSLPKIDLFRIDLNQFQGDIPNFSNSLTNLYLSNNNFIFGDMVGKTWLNTANLLYVPQATIPTLFSNGVLSVNTGISDGNNTQTFRWFKDGTLVLTSNSSQYTPSATGLYSCQIAHNTITVSSDANKNLVLQSNSYAFTALPIELLRFEGINKKNENVLTWETASEKNSQRFDIERSNDGKIFEKIGTIVTHNAASSYAFIDKNLSAPLHYYRLKLIDNDGSFSYSKIISISVETGHALSLRVYPNPTENSITLSSADYTQPTRLYNMTGALIFSSDITPTKINLSDVASGVYFLHVGEAVMKVVKE